MAQLNDLLVLGNSIFLGSVTADKFNGTATCAEYLLSPNDGTTKSYLDWTGSQTSCTYFATWDNTTYGSGKPTVRAMSAANMRANLNVPTKEGEGANGTWEISISGNANGASKLLTAKTFSISGTASDATAPKFDGTGNMTLLIPKTLTGFANITSAKFTSTGSPGFENTVAAGAWAYLKLTSGTSRWDIATNSSDSSGSLQFRPGGAEAGRFMIDYDGNVTVNGSLTTTDNVNVGGNVVKIYDKVSLTYVEDTESLDFIFS